MFVIGFFKKFFFFVVDGTVPLTLHCIAQVASVATPIIMLCHFVTLCTTNTTRTIFAVVTGTMQHNTDVVISAKLFVLMQVGPTRPAQVRHSCPETMEAANTLQSHLALTSSLSPTGYGFVDFDSPASAQKAVTALKAGGVQAQMAKVGTTCITFLMSAG